MTKESTKTFGEMFVESRGGAIRHGDMSVVQMLELLIDPECDVHFGFVASNTEVTQGLALKVKSGNLVINGHSITDAVLWRDTAPDIVVAHPVAARGEPRVRLRVWNVWRGASDVTQAWIGNAGLVVNDDDDGIVIHCSDGVGEPDFHDLIVRIEGGCILASEEGPLKKKVPQKKVPETPT